MMCVQHVRDGSIITGNSPIRIGSPPLTAISSPNGKSPRAVSSRGRRFQVIRRDGSSEFIGGLTTRGGGGVRR